MYYMGFSYREAYDLPVAYRRWFVERVDRELSRRGPNNEPVVTRAPQDQTREARALAGFDRAEVPRKLVRFT